jgi:hypothetical protein
MNTEQLYQRQAGFLDLGFSLVLLAVFGATAAVMTTQGEQGLPQKIVSYAERAQGKSHECDIRGGLFNACRPYRSRAPNLSLPHASQS